jgi:hypothetical protein
MIKERLRKITPGTRRLQEFLRMGCQLVSGGEIHSGLLDTEIALGVFLLGAREGDFRANTVKSIGCGAWI